MHSRDITKRRQAGQSIIMLNLVDVFSLKRVMTMFFQEVELKYHRLCQTQGEAAASEDNDSSQGGFGFFIFKSELNQRNNCMSLFFRRDSTMKKFPLTGFIWVLNRVTLASFTH